MMSFRLQVQLAEVLGDENRWFCAQCYGRKITDHDTLMRYFIEHGGAADFARRFDEAMGDVNRWYCSEHHRRPVGDPATLWKYYNMPRHAADAHRDHDCVST
jgi:hypothetical protein